MASKDAVRSRYWLFLVRQQLDGAEKMLQSARRQLEVLREELEEKARLEDIEPDVGELEAFRQPRQQLGLRDVLVKAQSHHEAEADEAKAEADEAKAEADEAKAETFWPESF